MKDLNTQEYWNERFKTGDWNLKGGQEQSRFFYQIALELLPEWLEKEIMNQAYSICDVGCAEGDGTVVLYDKFFNSDIYGIDFAEGAIELANNKYPNIQFNVGDIKAFECEQDILFSSNTLEHFRGPWSIAKNLINGKQKYTILLLPYNEIHRIDEHFSTFEEGNTPIRLGNASLVYYDIMDCNEIEGTYWAGEQVLLVYAHNIEEKLYEYTLKSMLDNTINQKQVDKMKMLISQVESLQKNINILEEEGVNYRNKLETASNEMESMTQKYERVEQEIRERININTDLSKKIEDQESLNKKLEKEVVNLQQIKMNLSKQLKEADLYTKKKTQSELTTLKMEIKKAEQELNDQIDKIEQLTYERDKFSQDLWRIHHSTFWKVAKKYYYLRDNLPIIRSIYKALKNKKNSNSVNVSEGINGLANPSINQESLYPKQVQKISDQLDKFLKDCVVEGTEQVLLVYSGVKFVESEGQRIIRLINEALLKDVKIIFCYWRWDHQEPLDQSHHENLLNIPIDIFLSLKDKVIDFKFNDDTNKTMLIEFPHPTTFHIISQANCKNWTTVYDVIDEWSEFHKVGEAIWYEEEIEKYLVNNSKFVTATAYQLGEKVKKYGVEEVTLIKNAVNPRGLVVQKESYNKGKKELNIGYFGHLTESWFDWKLVIELAQKNPDWTLHIIGYGAPEDLKLPENVHMYGKIEHKKLPEYARDWDVAIIPFKNSKLTESVDPIKVYEYLHLRLPVVATNMPDLKNYPYTQIANNVAEFEEAIAKLTNMDIDFEVMADFVKENTWERRLEQILELSERDSKFIVG